MATEPRVGWSTKLIVQSNRFFGLWAIDTPLEPLVTCRARTGPANDDEITTESLAALNVHILRFVRSYRVWLLVLLLGSPAALLMSIWIISVSVLGASDLPAFAAYAPGLLLYGALGAWYFVMMSRAMADPSYSLADRLATSLKRGTLGSVARQSLSGIPVDSVVRLYYGSLLSFGAQFPANGGSA